MSGSGCRHNMLNFFLYYCDFREKVRKTPGNILIRNCVMENPDRIFALNFDGQHKWCANRSLSSITFQNCQVSGVKQPAYIYGDAEEPIDFAMENVQITAREGYEEIPLLQAINYNSISLQQVTAEGIADPALVIASEGEIRTDSIFGIRRLAEPDEWYCTEEQ